MFGAAAFDKLALLHQRVYRIARRMYQERRNASVKQPDLFLSIIIDTMDQAKLEQPHYKIVPSNIKNMVCTVRTTLIDDIYEYPPFFIHFINYFRRNLNLIFIDFPRHEVDWSAGTRAWFLWISLARYVWP